MKENKLGIIGHFGGNKNFLDGQTVKTKILYEELNRKTNWKIKKIDTYYKKTNPIKLIFQTILAIIECDSIVILLSRNGMKIYLPLLYCCSKFLNKKISESFAITISAAAGSLINTILVMSGIWLFFGREYAATAGFAYETFLNVIKATIFTNGIIEAILAALISIAVIKALKAKGARV